MATMSSYRITVLACSWKWSGARKSTPPVTYQVTWAVPWTQPRVNTLAIMQWNAASADDDDTAGAHLKWWHTDLAVDDGQIKHAPVMSLKVNIGLHLLKGVSGDGVRTVTSKLWDTVYHEENLDCKLNYRFKCVCIFSPFWEWVRRGTLMYPCTDSFGRGHISSYLIF